MSSLVAPLRCPLCQSHQGSEVEDSRGNTAGTSIRRRRQCLACRQRFTTYERVGDPEIYDQQKARAKTVAAQLREMASALEVW